jgi:predicted dehydrogenase
MTISNRSKLKVAVIGCGEVAQKRHLPGFLRLKKGVSVSAVCDVDRSVANDVAEKFGIPHVYADFRELLALERPDVVAVCTPPKTHASIVTESMERGCHVFLEKPMALSVADCDNMISSSRKNGAKLCLAHTARFYPPYQKAQKLVKDGIIGKLTNMNILFSVPSSQYIDKRYHWINELPGGAIEECGPHAVYLSLPFLKEIKSVDAFAIKTSNHSWVASDNYNIALEGQEAVCHIVNTYGGDYTAFEIDLIGTKGLLKLDLQSMSLVFSRGQRIEPMSSSIRFSGVLLASYSLNVAGQIIRNVALNAFAALSGKTFVSHYILIQRFIESIACDKPVPVPPEEGRETVRIMEKIVGILNQKSSNAGAGQSVDPIGLS